MPRQKMTEDEKQAARQKKKELQEKIAREEAEKAQKWVEDYPNRVKHLVELLKEQSLKYLLLVSEDDLSISVDATLNILAVDDEHMDFDDLFLTSSTSEWEYIRKLDFLSYIKSRKADHKEFLDQVREFKSSLTQSQLNMIRYFNKV